MASSQGFKDYKKSTGGNAVMQLLQKIILDTKVLQLRIGRVRQCFQTVSIQKKQEFKEMNLYSFPRNKGDELNELNELNELALFSMNSKAKPLKDRRSFFAQLPRQAMEAETTRAQATAVKDHTKLTEADFPGSFRFFFSIEGDGGPC